MVPRPSLAGWERPEAAVVGCSRLFAWSDNPSLYPLGSENPNISEISRLQSPLDAPIRQGTAGGPSGDMVPVSPGRMEAYGGVCRRMGTATSISAQKRTPELDFQIMVFISSRYFENHLKLCVLWD